MVGLQYLSKKLPLQIYRICVTRALDAVSKSGISEVTLKRIHGRANRFHVMYAALLFVGFWLVFYHSVTWQGSTFVIAVEVERLKAESLRALLEFAEQGSQFGYVGSGDEITSVRSARDNLDRRFNVEKYFNDSFDIAHKPKRRKRNNVDGEFIKTRKGFCPVSPDDLDLYGDAQINLTEPSFPELEDRFSDLQPGGHWEPTDCIPRHNVAIVIPYRNRTKQLRVLIQHLHPFLQKQMLNYTIYVSEQIPGHIFNRGLSRNIGFLEAQKLDPSHECTYFHDVDLLPIKARNMYSCPEQPRHVCTGVDYVDHFRPLYLQNFAVFGGVTAFRNEHFERINGYSNIYIGWGAEDDDMYKRIFSRGMTVWRYPDHLGWYKGVYHVSEENQTLPTDLTDGISRYKLLNLADMMMDADGLTTADYKVLDIEKNKLFTHIVYDVEQNKYLQQGRAKTNVYNSLYRDLPERWSEVRYIPEPYWWLDPDVELEVKRINNF